jgi:lysozyme
MSANSKAWIPICATLLCTFEGIAYTATHEHIDPAGVITFCIGRTNMDDASVRVGQHFTKAQCEKYLTEDIPRYNEQMHRCIPKVQPPHREAALTSFTYNVGQGTVCKSSVAREINAGNITAGCNDLLRYDRAAGVVLKGLKRRREAERALCLQND